MLRVVGAHGWRGFCTIRTLGAVVSDVQRVKELAKARDLDGAFGFAAERMRIAGTPDVPLFLALIEVSVDSQDAHRVDLVEEKLQKLGLLNIATYNQLIRIHARGGTI